MPQAVALWASNALWAAGAGAVAAGVGGAAAWVATTVALTAGLSAASAKLAAKQANDSGRFQSRESPIASPKAPQVVVYGQTWVGGVVSYANSRHTPGSKDNFEMYKQFVHTCHECESITDLYYDEDKLRSGTEITWSTGTGLVTSGKYFATKAGTYAVMLEREYGTSTQTQSAMLTAAFPVDYPGSGVYRLRGWATTTHRFTYFSKTAKDTEGIFYSGVPNSIRALVKGMKVYDPRTGTTYWNDNPILCAADYMMRYMDIDSARIDWAWVATNANICDTSVAIPGALTEKRYTCNGAISLGNSHLVNLQQILSSCLGTLTKSAGLWRITAGAGITADVSITDADVVGEITMVGSVSRRDRYNQVTTSYFNPTSYGLEVDSLPVRSASYVTRDGGAELPVTISAPMTNGEYTAQRLAFKHLAHSDRQITITVPLRYIALAIAVDTRVNVTLTKYGWNNKIFRCYGWEPQPAGSEAPFIVSLREEDTATWADPIAADYSTRSADGTVTAGVVELPTPTAGGSAGEITVQNANFETGAWYWAFDTADWSIVFDAANAHQGDYVMKRVYAATATSVARNYITFATKPGSTVVYGGYVKTSGTPGGSWGWRVEFLDSAKSLISTFDAVTATPNTTWAELKGSASAPAGTHFVQLNAVTYSMSAGTVFFDDSFMLVNAGAEIGVDLGDGSGGIVDHIPPIVNVLGAGYYDSETTAFDQYKPYGTAVSTRPSNATAYIGSKSLLVEGSMTSGNTWGVQLVPLAATTPNLYIRPGRRWLIGVAAYPSTGIANLPFYASYSSNGTLTPYRTSTALSTGTGATWKMVWAELDGTSDSIIWTTLTFAFTNPTAYGANPLLYLDNIMMIDVTDQPWLTVANPPTTAIPASGANPRPPEAARLRYYRAKTVDETVASDAVLNNDGELVGWSLDAGSLYEFEGVIKFNSGATPDFATFFNFSSAPTSAIGWVEQVNAGGTQGFYWDATTLKQWEGGAASQALWFKIAILTNGATTVNFQWSQWSSTASNTTVEKGSFGVFSKIPPD